MSQNFPTYQEIIRKTMIDQLVKDNPSFNLSIPKSDGKSFYDTISDEDLEYLYNQSAKVWTPITPVSTNPITPVPTNPITPVSNTPITPVPTNPTFPAYTRNQSASYTPIFSSVFSPSISISPELGPYKNENIFSLSSLPASTSTPANLIPISNPSSPISEEPKENTETSKGQAQKLLDEYKTTVFNSSRSNTKTEGPVPITIVDPNKTPTPGYIPETQEPEPINTYEAPSYVPTTQEPEPVYTYEAPSYIAKNQNTKQLYSSSTPSYISKDASEDSFDEAFGFISPSYIPRGRQTAAKTSFTTSTNAPRYVARNKKTQETTQATASPSYISREYLKRASRY